MSKIHINSKGEPGVCRAFSKPCPFGSEDSHFSSVAEAEEAYAKAQDLMGNAASGKSKLGHNGERVLTFASEEDALKIANLLKNEGKTSAVSIISVRHVAEKEPEEGDYESYEDYEFEEERFWNRIRQGVGEFTEDPPIYQLRAFNSGAEALETSSSIDWNDKDLVPSSKDLKEQYEAMDRRKADGRSVPDEIRDITLDLFSESLKIEAEEGPDESHNGHDAYSSKLNYDQSGGTLKDVVVYFIPELPEE